MEKIMIDERTGWEYELIGEHYYPTGRVMRNGALTPSELPEDNGPEEEKPVGVWGRGTCGTLSNTRKTCILISMFPGG